MSTGSRRSTLHAQRFTQDVPEASGTGRQASSVKRTALLVELGRVGYGAALEFQHRLAAMRTNNEIPDTLILLEHPAVITLGKHADRKHLLVSDAELARRGVTVFQVERGGDITFHGPGQLVGYPVFKLGSGARGQGSGWIGVRRFVEAVEQALVLALAELGVKAAIRPGLIGVWTGPDTLSSPLQGGGNEREGVAVAVGGPRLADGGWRKIASIGVAVRRSVTFHGFALNVTTDLSYFDLMKPCGLAGVQMSSVEQEGGETEESKVRSAVVAGFEQAFGISYKRNLPRSLTSLTKGLSEEAISSASARE